MALMVLSLASRPGIKPAWSCEIMEGRRGSSLFARILEYSLMSEFNNDIGL